MRYAGREYRVVCTKSADKQMIIDIAPANSALHQLILQERQQRDGNARAVAGSISLYDMGEGNRPEIMFLPPDDGGLDVVELSAEQENMLRHKIAARFEEMMALNQESTITINPETHRNYVMGIINRINDANDTIAAASDAKSVQEEQNNVLTKRQQKAKETRRQTIEFLKRRDEKYSKYGVSALQIKQLMYRDY